MNFRRILASVGCALAATSLLAGMAFAAFTPDVDRTPYTKTIVPLGNGYGIARITNTQPSTDPNYAFRYISGGAISSAKNMGDGTYKVFGAQIGFGANGSNTDNDVSAFNFSFNPANPDILTVWRNWVYTSSRTPAAGMTDVGIGGVSNTGLVAVRVDGSSNGMGGSAIGGIDGASNLAGPVKLQPTNWNGTTVPGWTYMCSGGTSLVVPPTIGNESNLMAFESFANFLGCARVDLSPSGSASDNVHAEDMGTGQTRGGPTINSASHVAAIYAKTATDTDDQTSALRYMIYQDNGSSILTVTDTGSAYDFSGAIPGKICAATNFYGRTPFSGPVQVSVNDLGDVAFPVVIASRPMDTTKGDTAKVYWRVFSERAILFMDHNTPGVFKVVCRNDDGSSGPAMFYDGHTPYAPTISVAIDNSKNVFFEYTNWMGVFATKYKSTTCIYKATADSSSNPSKWSVKPIVWLGQQFKDAETGSTLSIALMNLGIAAGENLIATEAFSHKNLNRTPILGNSIGGFLISVGLGASYDPTGSTADNSLYMNACYVAPTNQQAATTTITQAKTLVDGEGVNLLDLVITSKLADVLLGANYWHQYTATDRSGDTIVFETIRPDLPVNGTVYVSGKMGTHAADSSRYIHGEGIVLVGTKRYGMAGKTTATTTLAINKPARVWGRVSSLNTTNKTFLVDDGSGSPVTVNYSAPYAAMASIDTDTTGQAVNNMYVPTNGDYVAASGDVTTAGTVTMSASDFISKLN